MTESEGCVAGNEAGDWIHAKSQMHIPLTIEQVSGAGNPVAAEQGVGGNERCCHQVFRDWDYTENETELCFYTQHVKIVINRETASFSYLDGEGKCLLKEREQDSKTLEEFTVYQLQEDSIRTEKVVTPDGVKEFVREAAKIPVGKSFHTRLYLEWAEEEALYGLGQRETDGMIIGPMPIMRADSG